MACDIRGLITDVLAIRAALTGPEPVKNGWRHAIDAQDKGWTCAFGNGGVGILAGQKQDKEELRNALEGLAADVVKIEKQPKAAVWGDGKFLDFLKFLIPILIGLFG